MNAEYLKFKLINLQNSKKRWEIVMVSHFNRIEIEKEL